MKTATTVTAQNTATALATIPASKVEIVATPEMIRPLATVLRDFTIEGNIVKLNKGATVTPGEFALMITDAQNTADSATTRNAYTLYEAGKVGEDVKKEVLKRLNTMLSKSAVYNLTSLADLVPMAIANGFKSPLTNLKDAVQALKANPNNKDSVIPVDKSGKIVLAKLKPAARALVPLLTAGTVTQAKVREIAKEVKSPAKRAAALPTLTKSAVDVDIHIRAFGVNADEVIAKRSELNAEQVKTCLNIMTKFTRAFGWNLAEAGK